MKIQLAKLNNIHKDKARLIYMTRHGNTGHNAAHELFGKAAYYMYLARSRVSVRLCLRRADFKPRMYLVKLPLGLLKRLRLNDGARAKQPARHLLLALPQNESMVSSSPERQPNQGL